MEGKIKDNEELRKKFANAFKLFEEEGVDEREDIKVKDSDTKKDKKELNEKFNELEFKFKSDKESLKEERIKHFKVLKFFPRVIAALIDQSLILVFSYLFFWVAVKPSMIDIPYKYIEGITYFMINDTSSFNLLLTAYFAISFLYYTLTNLFLKSTLGIRLLGFSIYRNEEHVPAWVIFIRNFVLIFMNIVFLFFPFWFIFISDDRQALYDKIFSVYFLKES